MSKKLTLFIWLVAGLTLLTLACRTIGIGGGDSTPSPTPKPWPHSTFVPPQKSVQIPVGQELMIESHHSSTEKLETIQVLVNGQPLPTEGNTAASQTNTFPTDLANVRVMPRAEAESAESGISTQNKTVLVFWTGQVPGIYELSMTATDALSRTGNTIVQRIEVK